MIISSPDELRSLKEGGKILSAILKELVKQVRPGLTTGYFNSLAVELMKRHRVQPSFLNYQRFPAVLCASVNDETVHAVPSGRVLNEGDLFKLDIGILHKGLHTDMAVTVLVTEYSRLTVAFKPEYAQKRKLMRVTHQALKRGIAQACTGKTLGDISAAIQNHIQANGFAVVRELGGHGIGRVLHEEPFIPNFGRAGKGQKLVSGMVLALEPITSMGSWRIKDSKDGFGYLTNDGSLSAHFEHTIVVTEKGPEIVTI